MKKNYKQPNTIVVKVKMQSMITVSPLGIGGTTQSKDDLLSREHNTDWEEDD